MAATFYEGGRRSGKSKYAVYKIEQYLNEGRRVVTNLDLFLHNLCPDSPKTTYTRIPDFPRSVDLFAIGKAYPSLDEDKPETYDENKNGLVVLDELLTSFNSRNWSDKDRIHVINWIVLSGKLGWDLIFIGQSFDAVDAQIRDTVVDRIVSFRSSENLHKGFFMNKFVQPISTKIFGKRHFASFYEGKTKAKENYSYHESFKHDHLHDCYKTGQVFKKDVTYNTEGKKLVEIDHRTSFTVIGDHYYNKQNRALVHIPDIKIKPKKAKPKYSLLSYSKAKILNVILLFTTIFFMAAYVLKQPVAKEVVLPVSETLNLKPKVKPKPKIKHIDYEKQRIELDMSDLRGIYINCYVFSSDGRSEYCFTNYKGQPVNPGYIGYKVLHVNECHSKLIRGDIILDVFCNPVRELDNSPINNDFYQEEPVEVASN